MSYKGRLGLGAQPGGGGGGGGGGAGEGFGRGGGGGGDGGGGGGGDSANCSLVLRLLVVMACGSPKLTTELHAEGIVPLLAHLLTAHHSPGAQARASASAPQRAPAGH